MPRRKVFLDENIDLEFNKGPNLILDPAKYDVVHLQEFGLKGIDNGGLLKSVASRGFDLLITNDGAIKLEQRHQMNRLPIAVLVLTNTDILLVTRMRSTIQHAVELIKKGQYATMETKQRPRAGDRLHPWDTRIRSRHVTPSHRTTNERRPSTSCSCYQRTQSVRSRRAKEAG